jgi:hypothetical protein
MGREARYRHCLLFGDEAFHSPDDPADPGSATTWDSLLWESFLERVASAFRAVPITDPARRWAGGALVYHVAETPRLLVGLDQTARPSVLFAAPKSYERRGGAILKPYKVDREATAALRRLVRACPDVAFRPPARDGPSRPNNPVVAWRRR